MLRKAEKSCEQEMKLNFAEEKPSIAATVRVEVGGRGSSGSRRRRWCLRKEISTSAIQRGRRKRPRWHYQL
jgi:hypothetical protein